MRVVQKVRNFKWLNEEFIPFVWPFCADGIIAGVPGTGRTDIHKFQTTNGRIDSLTQHKKLSIFQRPHICFVARRHFVSPSV